MKVSGSEHWVNVPSLASWKTHPEYQQDAFVEQGCPRRQQSPNMAHITVLFFFYPAPPPGACDISEVYRQPLDELVVQVWLLYGHANFKYCTSYVSGTKLRTGDEVIRLQDAPGRSFKKTMQIRKLVPGMSKLFLLATPWVSKAIKLQSVKSLQVREGLDHDDKLLSWK